jgi:hypothetical protein
MSAINETTTLTQAEIVIGGAIYGGIFREGCFISAETSESKYNLNKREAQLQKQMKAYSVSEVNCRLLH